MQVLFRACGMTVNVVKNSEEPLTVKSRIQKNPSSHRFSIIFSTQQDFVNQCFFHTKIHGEFLEGIEKQWEIRGERGNK